MARAVPLLPESQAVLLRPVQAQAELVKRLPTAVSVSSLMLAMPVAVQLMKLWS